GGGETAGRAVLWCAARETAAARSTHKRTAAGGAEDGGGGIPGPAARDDRLQAAGPVRQRRRSFRCDPAHPLHRKNGNVVQRDGHGEAALARGAGGRDFSERTISQF